MFMEDECQEIGKIELSVWQYLAHGSHSVKCLLAKYLQFYQCELFSDGEHVLFGLIALPYV
jgi:hypothetical protein